MSDKASAGGKIFNVMGALLLVAALLLSAFNLWSDAMAGSRSSEAIEGLSTKMGQATGSGVPDYVLNPNMEMPEREFDGESYIGVLRIPALSLQLPIISRWSYPRLRIAPCRYAGSAYLDNMVIAGHNYQSHFGRLKTLSPGDEVSFTDVDANLFTYRVTEIDTLSPYAVDDMTTGDWDLTLFTCTLGGRTRVTVRCDRVPA